MAKKEKKHIVTLFRPTLRVHSFSQFLAKFGCQIDNRVSRYQRSTLRGNMEALATRWHVLVKVDRTGQDNSFLAGVADQDLHSC